MRSLIDVNVVFAILVGNHAHHAAAWQWWLERDEASVALSLPVKLGALRLLTNKVAMEDCPVSPSEALNAWESFEEDPRTLWIADTQYTHENYFRRFIEGRKVSPNLWTDAWLAALAESSAIGLTSFDAGFRSFEMRDFEHLAG